MNEEILKEAEKLIADGKISEAIEFLQARTRKNDDIQKELNLLTSRFSLLKQQERQGLISAGDFRVEINRLNHSFLSILDSFNAVKKIDSHSVLVDRVKLSLEAENLKKNIENFKSDIKSLTETGAIVKDFFAALPVKIKSFSEETKIKADYTRNPFSEFDGILNFKEKGSIHIVWYQRFSNSLEEAGLVFKLFDRYQSYIRIPRKGYEPQLINSLAFYPTIDKSSNIGWCNDDFTFLKTEELYDRVIELMLMRLEG